MQKVGLFLAFVLLTFAVDPEKCVQEKCPSEYNACKKAVFGCASKALNCKNKCGSSDPACFEKCCYDSHDAKLIALYECGKANCSTTDYWNLGSQLEECSKQLVGECFQKKSIECIIQFPRQHPECLH